MFQGNWKCSGCGGAITELPFQPKSEANLLCRDCHSKQRGSTPRASDGGQGERKKFTGDWSCSGCNAAIASLPFEPRDTSNLLCIDCYKKRKGG